MLRVNIRIRVRACWILSIHSESPAQFSQQRRARKEKENNLLSAAWPRTKGFPVGETRTSPAHTLTQNFVVQRAEKGKLVVVGIIFLLLNETEKYVSARDKNVVKTEEFVRQAGSEEANRTLP